MLNSTIFRFLYGDFCGCFFFGYFLCYFYQMICLMMNSQIKPVEKQQELIRSVYGGWQFYILIRFLQITTRISGISNIATMVSLTCISILISFVSCFGIVLCSRAENVSNFVEAESIFGPVRFPCPTISFSTVFRMYLN